MASRPHPLVDPERPPDTLVALTNGSDGRVKHAVAPGTVDVNECGRVVRPPACDPMCEYHAVENVLVTAARDDVARTTEQCSVCFDNGGGL